MTTAKTSGSFVTLRGMVEREAKTRHGMNVSKLILFIVRMSGVNFFPMMYPRKMHVKTGNSIPKICIAKRIPFALG